MASSDRFQPHGARLSMIPVYLRSGEDSSSSTRRASLPNPPQKPSRENYTTTRKSVIHDLSESSTKPNPHRPTFDPHLGETASQNGLSAPNSSKRSQQRFSCKPDPRRILATLERLAQPGLNVHELMDIRQLLAIHEQDLADIAEREDRVKGKWQVDGPKAAIFGMPLREAAKYASTSALFNGNELYLPLVVFDCVEELYRTGIYKQDLFRILPNRQRLAELIHIFNSPNPHLNYRSKNRRNKVAEYNTTLLHLESTQDICALLIDYLCSIPEPILPTYLFGPIWEWGGVYGDTADDNSEVGGDATSFINESQRRADFFPLPKFHPEEPSEATRISAVQHLLCLLPSPNFSLLVYLLAFFSHVVMMRDVNGMDIQELGRLFGKCVFGGGSASSPSGDYESIGKARKPGQAMMCWFLKRWGPISNGLFDVVSVRAEQGRPPVIMGGRVKPKSPIDLNSRPSPSAWLSTKERNKDVEWSMALLSPGAISYFTIMSSPSLHSPKSYFGITAETARDKEILAGPGILRKNVRNDCVDEPGTGMVKPSATPVQKRLTPIRTPTVASINSAVDINERLLDVSFSPLFHDLHVFDAIISRDAASCPVTDNGVPEMSREAIGDNICLTGVADTGPELAQALGRIRDLEHQLDGNDTILRAALEIMFRAKRRVDEIDDRLKELEVTLRVSRSQSERLGLVLCPQCSDEEAAVDLWREPQKAHDIVVELRSLMLREL